MVANADRRVNESVKYLKLVSRTGIKMHYFGKCETSLSFQ